MGSSYRAVVRDTAEVKKIKNKWTRQISRDNDVVMFFPGVFVCLFRDMVCVCVCLSRCLSERFNCEGLVPHRRYFAGRKMGVCSCTSYVLQIHDIIDDVTRSKSRPNVKIVITQFLSYSVETNIVIICVHGTSFWHIWVSVLVSVWKMIRSRESKPFLEIVKIRILHMIVPIWVHIWKLNDK